MSTELPFEYNEVFLDIFQEYGEASDTFRELHPDLSEDDLYEAWTKEVEALKEQFEFLEDRTREINSHVWVFRHKESGRLFSLEVPYDSWSGDYWDDIDEDSIIEVEAVEKTVIVYEPIGGNKNG